MAWHELTFTGSHVLTASDMNRVQENFTALAQGHSGAPALAVNSFVASGVASLGTLHVSSALFYAGTPLVPAGAVIPYAGTAAPPGWMLCDGAAVSRAAYAALYAVIGATFGAGDGGTTFNLPDLRGRAVVALDNLGGSSANRIAAAWADSLGGNGGEDTHTLTVAEIPDHTHDIAHAAGSNTATGGTGNRISFSSFGNHEDTRDGGSNSPGNGAHNNLQPSLALAYIIKY
jgi:microcystin-dependent protein